MPLLASKAQLKYLIFAPCAIAPLSIFGSSLVILTIHRTRRQAGNLQTYHRLLLGISACDVILSTGLALGPLPVPKETNLPGAHGNTKTCTLQGFLLQLGCASFAYTNMLMLYYVLVIRYNVRESVIAHHIEPILHVVPIGYHLGTAILGCIWQVFNPSGTYCWVAPYPFDCLENTNVPCQRGGDHVDLFGYWLLTLPMVVWTFSLCFFLVVIAWTVWRRQCQSKRFVFEGCHRPEDVQRTRQVVTQCLLYAGTYLNVIVWSTMGTLLDLRDKDSGFWISAMAISFFPIQGLFSFLIYIRPRYLAVRRADRYPKSRWYAIYQAVWYPVRRRSSISRRSIVGNGSHSSTSHRNFMKQPSLTTSAIAAAIKEEQEEAEMTAQDSGLTVLEMEEFGLREEPSMTTPAVIVQEEHDVAKIAAQGESSGSNALELEEFRSRDQQQNDNETMKPGSVVQEEWSCEQAEIAVQEDGGLDALDMAQLGLREQSVQQRDTEPMKPESVV